MDVIDDSTKIKAKRKAEQASNDVKPWIRGFARFGYMSMGMVYILIGILAMMAAAGVGGKTTDTSGAFASVAEKPFGEVLLWAVAVGLIGYVMWQAIQVFLDPENKGTDFKGLFTRFSYLIAATIYTVIALKAAKIALHAGSTGGSKQTWTAKLLAQPFGQWIIGIVGIIIIGFGCYQIYNGYKERFMIQFKTNEMSSHERRLNCKIGKLGLIARGITFLIIGYFILRTAISADSNKIVGLDGALGKIAAQPFGQILLGAVAIGLFLYGVFQVMQGKNRHMKLP
ncbi:DUF1206 domain-containing protein [Pseudalkalibacillus decolorationis]|uniref:DUF1206 domain-containing protein n=1 Tax=Pseudalkalibacillus decolorationis TaxID=163879 RepID=UPI002148AC06|nr:DUF1206 domain-containing protein [Pseudalkalibacillus decolorationis]